jgi:hypothetical protein
MIKLPVPVAYRYFARNFYRYAGSIPNFPVDYPSLKPEALYTEAQLKQVIHDALEEMSRQLTDYCVLLRH